MKVARTEDKYIISYSDYIYLKNLLEPFAELDRGKEYWIRSLYFDSIDDKDYFAKVNGDEKHKKIRLRIYSLDDKKVKLELKKKINKFSEKDSTIITRDHAEALIEGDFCVLNQYDTEGSRFVYAESKSSILLPVTMIDYDREAYCLPAFDTRITFDRRVRTSLSEKLFSKEENFFPLMEDNLVILEVKYNSFLPQYVKEMISSVALNQVSVSKYIMARQM